MVHKLKTWPDYFQAVKDGKKNFEVRKNDRNFKVGDEVILREFDPENSEYTGRVCFRKITFILDGGQFGIDEGVVVLGLKNTK